MSDRKTTVTMKGSTVNSGGQDVIYLNQLERPRWMIDKLSFFNSVSNGLLNIRVTSFVQSEAWEQVVDQAHEEWFIFVDKLAQVHVAKNSHHNTIFTVLSAEDKRINIGCLSILGITSSMWLEKE